MMTDREFIAVHRNDLIEVGRVVLGICKTGYEDVGSGGGLPVDDSHLGSLLRAKLRVLVRKGFLYLREISIDAPVVAGEPARSGVLSGGELSGGLPNTYFLDLEALGLVALGICGARDGIPDGTSGSVNLPALLWNRLRELERADILLLYAANVNDLVIEWRSVNPDALVDHFGRSHAT
jgi:hypothetical protein